jgi:DNA primase
MGTWIDFKTLRAELRFEAVLRHYGVEVKRKGDQHHGFCPLPNHQGQKNSPSFSAHLGKGIFQCFGCGAKGNIIDFAVLMEKLDPESGADVRRAALILQERFSVRTPGKPKKHVAEQPELRKPEAVQPAGKVVVNAPLDFELKRLDPDHPYLDTRGFSKETIVRFGLGYCAKGLLAGRIAIPLHSPDGKLLGYAGRVVDNSKINDDNPRYKFPPKREREGVTYEFHKLLMLYNSHRLKAPVESLAIVEGFASVWWLTQMGCPNAVALMGWTMSLEQARIVTDLVPTSGRVFVITDGDESGDRCAQSVFEQIAPFRFLKWLKLDEGKQPTDYPGGWLRTQLGV